MNWFLETQEDVETSVGEFVYAPTGIGIGIGIGIGQENGITPEVSSLQYSSQDFEHQNNKFETSPETSISGCEDSLEIMNGRSNGNGIDEQQLNFKEIRDEQRLPLMEPVEMLDGNIDADAGGLTFSLHHRSEMETETETNGCTGSGESSGMESDEQHPAKRMRTTESFVEGGSACN